MPTLESLRLEIEERASGASVPDSAHVRHIVVDHAPAMFEITCGDPACRDGGHDLTVPIMQALRAKQTEFQGEDACQGRIGDGSCSRTIKFVARATFAG